MRSSTIGCLMMVLLSACDRPVESSAAPAGQLRLGGVLGSTDLDGYAIADQIQPFVFPDDHGPHPTFRSEWWYLTCILEDPAGNEFGVQFTLFRQALAPRPLETANRWQSNQAYLAHFAVTDVAAGSHSAAERAARGHPQLAGVVADPFSLWLEDWRIDSVADRWRLSLGTSEQGAELELDMSGPIVPQGDSGLSHKGKSQASYYYSMPAIPITGRLRVEGVEHVVSGSGWLDREWSTSVLSDQQVGWDWFALKLDDQTRMMVFQLRRRDGKRDAYDQGVRLQADGQALALSAEDFDLTPLRHWTDASGVRWPVAWRLRIADDSWRVEAAVDDQLMSTAIVYWEGLVNVYDSSESLVGRGYLELTGYD